MNKMTEIPSLNKALDHEKLHESITKNYSEISKVYTTFLIDWITSTFKAFNDSDKFHILLCIFKRNLNFYNDNLIKFNYDTFNKTNRFDIQKINIVEIANNLNIPKETARRKILELEKQGVIKRRKKEIIIDKNSFVLFDILNTIKSLTNLLFKISNLCLKEKIILKNVSKEDIYNKMKKKFSYVMFHYFEFIIPWTTKWKSFFDNDTELFVIWSVIVLNKTVKIVKQHDEKLNISNWRAEIGQINTQGINTMSLSEITGIPRPTVSRKIKKLLNRKLATIDESKLIHPELAMYKKELASIHNSSVSTFSKFFVIIWNLLIFN